VRAADVYIILKHCTPSFLLPPTHSHALLYTQVESIFEYPEEVQEEEEQSTFASMQPQTAGLPLVPAK